MSSQIQYDFLHWLWNVPGWNKKQLEYTTSKNRVPGWVTSQKMVTEDLLFHFFPRFSPLPHRLKSTKLIKIYISTRNYSLSKVNLSIKWRNTLGKILLEIMDESPVWFTTITNIISSNPSPHIVVPFILVSLHWQA